ncbi:MAG: hypothetical protein HY556_10825 [Euryarchaeota archaeon]|nr:hypothetical protein [Euryarchaeota archaeon]
MRRRSSFATVFVLMAVILGLAAVQVATAKTAHVGSFTIQPGRFGETDLNLSRGDVIEYEWSTSPPTVIGFNVHTHRDDKTIEYNEARNVSGKGAYTAPETGTHSILWDPDPPATRSFNVTFRLGGNYACLSSVPEGLCAMTAPSDGSRLASPGAGVTVIGLLVAAAGVVAIGKRRRP